MKIINHSKNPIKLAIEDTALPNEPIDDIIIKPGTSARTTKGPCLVLHINTQTEVK